MTSAVLLLLGAFAGVLGGCVGELGEAPAQDALPGDGPDAKLEPAPASLRMLTIGEYEASIHDLLGASIKMPADLPYQARSDGFTTVASAEIDAEAVGLLAEKLDEVSRDAAQQAFADSASRTKLVACSPSGVEDPCVDAFLSSFGQRAWRRSLLSAEVSRYHQVVVTVTAELGDVWKGLELATAALLASPNFLYKVELGESDPSDPSRRRYGNHEMASRLSYFIWGTMPDQALLDAAAAGELVTLDGVRAQALRLLEAPRGKVGLMRALEEHLHIDQIGSLTKDPVAFPEMNATLARSMGQEMSLLVEDVLFARGEDFRELFVTRETFVNPQLAAFYGLAKPESDAFESVDLPLESGRMGLLSTAGFLASNAKLTRASAVARGVFINDRLLCRPIPPPPPDVSTSALDDQQDGLPKTMRERLTVHSKEPKCASCHSLIDPLGLPLEHFDGIGRYRATDRGMTIDASGELENVKFDGAVGEGETLRGSKIVGPCFVKQVYRYATGHLESSSEAASLQKLSTALEAADGFRMPDVVMAIVTSDAFRYAGEPR